MKDFFPEYAELQVVFQQKLETSGGIFENLVVVVAIMSEISKRTTDVLTQDVNEQLLSCPICAEPYSGTGDRVPKILPCYHGLCEKCLNQLPAKSRNITIQCPTCRQVSEVPVSGGVSSLPNNYVILELLDIFKKHQDEGNENTSIRTYSSRKRRALACCNCDSPTTESDCKGCDECDGAWCGECQDIHVRGKLYKSHKLLSYAEYLEKGKTKASFASSAVGSSTIEIRCKQHNSKDIDLYCLDCGEMVCAICYVSDHSGHRMTLIQEAAKVQEEKIREIITVVKESQGMLESAAVLASRNKISFEQHLAGLGARIQVTAQMARDAISNKEQKALSELHVRTVESMDWLTEEQLRLDGIVGRVRESTAAADTVLRCGSTFDICRSAPKLKYSLQTLSTEIENQQKQQEGEQPRRAARLVIVSDTFQELQSTVD